MSSTSDGQRSSAPEGLRDESGSSWVVGSAAGPRAADHVLRELRQNAEVVLVCVLPHEAEPGGNERARRDNEARVANMTKATLETLGSGGISARTAVAFGQAGEEIVRLADHEQADLIIVCRRGAGLSRALLGSASDHIVKHATRPVLIVE